MGLSAPERTVTSRAALVECETSGGVRAAARGIRVARRRHGTSGRRVADAERILLLSRIREGIAIDEVPAANRSSVAGLIADGLVDPAAAIRGRVQLTLRGRLLADAVVRELTD